MMKDTTKEAAVAAEALLLDDWFDAIEDGVRARARGFIETMLEEELSEALSRPRYGRRKPGEDEAAPSVVGVRHGHRERTLTGTFGKTLTPLAFGKENLRGRGEQSVHFVKRLSETGEKLWFHQHVVVQQADVRMASSPESSIHRIGKRERLWILLHHNVRIASLQKLRCSVLRAIIDDDNFARTLYQRKTARQQLAPIARWNHNRNAGEQLPRRPLLWR